MKKTIAIFLSILLLLGMTAFIGPRTANAAAASTRSDESAEEAVINAFSKACEAKSLRCDSGVTMDMAMKISAQGASMDIPIRLNMRYGIDYELEPYRISGEMRMDMDMGFYGSQSEHTLLYGCRDGEKHVTYSSEDEGETWTALQSDDLYALPTEEVFGLIRDHVRDIRRAGTETFQGREVTVYTGRLEGKFLSKVLILTGLDEAISEITNEDMAPMDLGELGDIPLTIYIDGDGYPVYYDMDVMEVMEGLLTKTLQGVIGMEGMEGVEIDMVISAAQGEVILSDFDAVEPIVIPEAALNAPEA